MLVFPFLRTNNTLKEMVHVRIVQDIRHFKKEISDRIATASFLIILLLLSIVQVNKALYHGRQKANVNKTDISVEPLVLGSGKRIGNGVLAVHSTGFCPNCKFNTGIPNREIAPTLEVALKTELSKLRVMKVVEVIRSFLPINGVNEPFGH
jgi:hypothetical protein